MALIPLRNSAADAAQRVRRIVTQIGRQATGAVRNINNIATKVGRSNLLEAMGDDAQDLLAFHTAIRGMARQFADLEMPALPEDPAPEPEVEPEPDADVE